MKKVGRLFRESLIEDIKNGIKDNNDVFLISYSKVSGLKMSDLRKMLKNAGARVYISKNSSAKLALKELNYEKLAEKVFDQTAFVWSNSDSVEISKILVSNTVCLIPYSSQCLLKNV